MNQKTIPDARTAFVEALAARYPTERCPYSHVVVYHAAKEFGFHLLRTARPEDTAKLFPRFEEVFYRTVRRFHDGEDLNIPEGRAIKPWSPQCEALSRPKIEHLRQVLDSARPRRRFARL